MSGGAAAAVSALAVTRTRCGSKVGGEGVWMAALVALPACASSAPRTGRLSQPVCTPPPRSQSSKSSRGERERSRERSQRERSSRPEKEASRGSRRSRSREASRRRRDEGVPSEDRWQPADEAAAPAAAAAEPPAAPEQQPRSDSKLGDVRLAHFGRGGAHRPHDPALPLFVSRTLPITTPGSLISSSRGRSWAAWRLVQQLGCTAACLPRLHEPACACSGEKGWSVWGQRRDPQGLAGQGTLALVLCLATSPLCRAIPVSLRTRSTRCPAALHLACCIAVPPPQFSLAAVHSTAGLSSAAARSGRRLRRHRRRPPHASSRGRRSLRQQRSAAAAMSWSLSCS